MKRERCCLRKLGFTHKGTLRHRSTDLVMHIQ